jgi:EF hand
MSITQKRWKVVFGIAGILALGTMVPMAVTAQSPSSTPTSAQPTPAQKDNKKLKAGEKEAKKLLLLMDKDQNGMISKQEFMNFMEAEFDRLDADKSGQLDVSELTKAQIRTRSPISR